MMGVSAQQYWKNYMVPVSQLFVLLNHHMHFLALLLFEQRSGGKHSTTPADNYYLARRRTLQVVVSSLLTEAGFESAEKAAVETLTEMLQSCEYSQLHNTGFI